MYQLAGMGSELMAERNDNIEPTGGAFVYANAAVAGPGDCGCGCGGSGDCGGAVAVAGGVHQARRKFLIGGVGLSTFAATLASRPAHAALCNNLTALYSPSGSHHTGVCNASGKTPGFWKNHAGCWPSGITPNDTFSTWFGSVYFIGSGQTLGEALCNPGVSNLAFQIAGGLLNAQSPYTSPSYGYGSAQAFADSVIAAFKANSTEAPSYPSVQIAISNMNSDNSSIGAWCPNKTICS